MTQGAQKKKKAAALLARELATLKLNRTQPPKKKKKPTPFANGGQAIGGVVGNMIGVPGLAGIGKWLGSGIGSIFGSGDYAVTGPSTSYNVLSGQVPQFSSTHATNIVCHREYIGDIIGTTGFNNVSYPINPGVAKTFPWLSTVAVNYQQYRFHGVVFEFRPLLTDFVTGGAPGIVVLTTNYNADQPPFLSRQEAENAEFAASCKPTVGMMHMIECKPDEQASKLYNVRNSAVPVNQDLRLYDLGLTQFITQNNPSGSPILGELYVSYCVEFFKPTLALANEAAMALGLHLFRTGVTSAAPLGTTTVRNTGGITGSVSSTVLTLTDLVVGVNYKIDIICYAATSSTYGISGATGFATFPILNNGASNSAVSNAPGLISTITILDTATATTATLTFNAVVVGTASCDLFVTALDPQVTQ